MKPTMTLSAEEQSMMSSVLDSPTRVGNPKKAPSRSDSGDLADCDTTSQGTPMSPSVVSSLSDDELRGSGSKANRKCWADLTDDGESSDEDNCWTRNDSLRQEVKSGATKSPDAIKEPQGATTLRPNAPEFVMSTPVPAKTWYRVAYLGGIDLRREPNYAAIRTGVTLCQNEVFAVSQEIAGTDGRTYLLLADGRGWAFDDSILMPHEPSVKKGAWAPVQAPAPPTPLAPVATVARTMAPWALPSPYAVAPALAPPTPLAPALAPAPAPPPPPTTMPRVDALTISIAPETAPGSVNETLYRIAYIGGLDLRREPNLSAIRTGITLRQNEVFAVSQEIAGTDGRIYLRLSDGRGWAFDDSAIIPHDPSVKKGTWAAPGTWSHPAEQPR